MSVAMITGCGREDSSSGQPNARQMAEAPPPSAGPSGHPSPQALPSPPAPPLAAAEGETSAKQASEAEAPGVAPTETTIFGRGLVLSLEVGPFSAAELPADFSEQVEARLQRSLETLGCRVADGQPIRLIATCTEGKTETRRYEFSRLGAPLKFGASGLPEKEIVSVSVAACDCRLALIDASGSTMWAARSQFRPRLSMFERVPGDADPATYVQEKVAKEVALSVQKFFLSTDLPSTKRTRPQDEREPAGANNATNRPRAAPERVKTPAEDPNHPDYWKQNLDDMLQAHLLNRNKAIARLAKADPEKVPSGDLRKEIARAFKEVALDRRIDGFARANAVEGLATWGGTYSVPLLIQLLESDDRLVHQACYPALAKLKDERAIEPVTRRFVGDFAERREAAECLAAIGSKAEDAVLKLARPDDMSLARETVVLLGKIGTKKSLQALTMLRAQRYYPAIHGNVELAASAIMLREKEKH